MLEVTDWSLGSWSSFRNDHWCLIHPFSKFWLSILILMLQRTSISFKPWFGALEDSGGSSLGFCILMLNWIWLLVYGIPMFQICALYFNLEDANNMHVLKLLISGFRVHLRFLTRVWHLYLDLYMVNCLWSTHGPNFGSLSWFWWCKEHVCPLSPDLGFWRMLNVPDWVWHPDLDLDMFIGL